MPSGIDVKNFEVKYYNNDGFSHKYDESWEKDDLFCPHCGNKEVWCQQGEGDYYEGLKRICVTCEVAFYMPRIQEITGSENDLDVQRLKQLIGRPG